MPLLAFLLFVWIDFSNGVTFALACVLTAITLFGLGFLKGRLTSSNPIWAGAGVLVNGVLAAGKFPRSYYHQRMCSIRPLGSAYLIGWGLAVAVNVSENQC